MTASKFRNFVMMKYWRGFPNIKGYSRWAWGHAVIDAQKYYEPQTHTYGQVASFIQDLEGIGIGEKRMEVTGWFEFLGFLDKYFPFKRIVIMENE